MYRLKQPGSRELSTCQVCGQPVYKILRCKSRGQAGFPGWWHSDEALDRLHKAVPAHAGMPSLTRARFYYSLSLIHI